MRESLSAAPQRAPGRRGTSRRARALVGLGAVLLGSALCACGPSSHGEPVAASGGDAGATDLERALPPPAPPAGGGPGSADAPRPTRWTLAADVEGALRWTDPAPPGPGESRDVGFPQAAPAELGVRARLADPWGPVRTAIANRYQHGQPALFVEAPEGTWRVLLRAPSADLEREAVALDVLLAGRDGGPLELRVQAFGGAWIGRYGCARTAPEVAPWHLGVGVLRSWLARALEAVEGRGEEVHVRLRADEATIGDLLVLVGVVQAAGIRRVDLGAPQPPAPGPRTTGVERGLSWLAAHQAADGSWSGLTWAEACEGQSQAHALDADGEAGDEVATTGLVLTAYLGAGYTNRGQHPYAKTVARGLRFLKSAQRPEGAYADPSARLGARGHAWATLAMWRAYALTESPIFKGSAQKALEALPALQGSRDPLVVGPAALALATVQRLLEDHLRRGRRAPVELDASLVANTRHDLRVLDVRRGDLSTAVALAGARVLGGEDDPWAASLPALGALGADAHPAYAAFGALAAYHVAGEAWKRWNEGLRDRVVDAAEPGPRCCLGGSWSPPAGLPLAGGRVEATAWAVLALETYYRYVISLDGR